MQNAQILKMIENGEIEELKRILRDEIYRNSLSRNPDVKSRYSAMKRFFKYVDSTLPAFNFPCENVVVKGKTYTSFLNSYCFALTTESIGEIEPFDEKKARSFYPNVNRYVSSDALKSGKIDFSKAIAMAKEKGYSYRKDEVADNWKYSFGLYDAFFKVGLVDKVFSIINDGEPAEFYYAGPVSLLLIKTSIGIGGILPFKKMSDYNEEGNKITFIDANEMIVTLWQ